MITKHLAVVSILALLACSCSKKEENKNESSSLHYEMKTFRLESAGGCKSDTASCASYEVNYPVFQGLSTVANDSLTYKISEAVDTGNPELDSMSFRLAGKDFISSFEKTKKEMPDQAMGWYYKSTLTVNVVTDTLISIEAGNEFFTGGAHGGYGTYFINLQPSSGKTILLSDILKPGYEEVLRKEGEIAFRKALQLEDTTSLVNEGFEFPYNKFSLNDNYGFTKEGVLFVFNAYEIAPYAMGAQEVLIPYEKIKNWLR